jgi:hypothetical protein
MHFRVRAVASVFGVSLRVRFSALSFTLWAVRWSKGFNVTMADRSEGQAAYSREVRSRVDLEGPLLYRTMRRDVRVDREVRAEGYTEKARGTDFTMKHKCGGQAEKVNATACEV